MQMRRLEERVGKQLFAKDGRGNRLTAEGEKLLNYARRIIRLNNEAIAAFDDNRLEGTLRIGTPDDMPIVTCPRSLDALPRPIRMSSFISSASPLLIWRRKWRAASWT